MYSNGAKLNTLGLILDESHVGILYGKVLSVDIIGSLNVN